MGRIDRDEFERALIALFPILQTAGGWLWRAYVRYRVRKVMAQYGVAADEAKAWLERMLREGKIAP